jgi:hypothetical protein
MYRKNNYICRQWFTDQEFTEWTYSGRVACLSARQILWLVIIFILPLGQKIIFIAENSHAKSKVT